MDDEQNRYLRWNPYYPRSGLSAPLLNWRSQTITIFPWPKANPASFSSKKAWLQFALRKINW
jgi:hypothetical protein